jgi:hypothetical protein
VELPKKLKAPDIRELTLAELQQLRDLGEKMAEQAIRAARKKSTRTFYLSTDRC